MLINSRPLSYIYKVILVAAVLYGVYMSIFGMTGEMIRVSALSYFTIQSNILVVAALLFFIFCDGESRLRTVIRGAVLLTILVTGPGLSCRLSPPAN